MGLGKKHSSMVESPQCECFVAGVTVTSRDCTRPGWVKVRFLDYIFKTGSIHENLRWSVVSKSSKNVSLILSSYVSYSRPSTPFTDINTPWATFQGEIENLCQISIKIVSKGLGKNFMFSFFQCAILSLGPGWGEVRVLRLPNLYKPHLPFFQTSGIVIVIFISIFIVIVIVIFVFISNFYKTCFSVL